MPKVRNPILPGFNADPAIVRVGKDGKQWMLSTNLRYVLLTSGSAYSLPFIDSLVAFYASAKPYNVIDILY